VREGLQYLGQRVGGLGHPRRAACVSDMFVGGSHLTFSRRWQLTAWDAGGCAVRQTLWIAQTVKKVD
jgi:hypothetical protein